MPRPGSMEALRERRLRKRVLPLPNPYREALLADDDDPPAAPSPNIEPRPSPSIAEMLATERRLREVERSMQPARGSRPARVNADDLDALLDPDDEQSGEPILTEEARQYHVQQLLEDLRCECHASRLLARDTVSCWGRIWRIDSIIERLLARPTAASIDLVRRLELAREAVHRTVARDLEQIRLLKFPAGGIGVQVQAAATDGGQVNVAVAPAGPIPKRRR